MPNNFLLEFFALYWVFFLPNLMEKKEALRGLSGNIIDDISMFVGFRYQNFSQVDWIELCNEIVAEKTSFSDQALFETISTFDNNLNLYLDGAIGIQKLRENVGVAGRKWFFRAVELSTALDRLFLDLGMAQKKIRPTIEANLLQKMIQDHIGPKKYTEFFHALKVLHESTKQIKNYFGKRIINSINSARFPDENRILASAFRHKILSCPFIIGKLNPLEFCKSNFEKNKKTFLLLGKSFYKLIISDFETLGYINSTCLLAAEKWPLFRSFAKMMLFESLGNSIGFQYDQIDDEDPLELVFELFCSEPEKIIDTDLGSLDSADSASKILLTKDLLNLLIESAPPDESIFDQTWLKRLTIFREQLPELKPIIYRKDTAKLLLNNKWA